jgi:hypothetical protein
MGFDEKTGRMDWRDELSWIAVAAVSGVLQWLLFRHFGTFAATSPPVVLALTLLAFYLPGVLVRVQNARGRALTGRRGFPERALIRAFPLPGFMVGLALIVLR